MLGGLISSTATTASYAKRTRHAENAAVAAAVVLLIATCVMYVRVLIFVFVVSREQFLAIAPPIAAVLLATALASAILALRSRGATLTIPEQENPTELKFALLFALVYALVLLLIALAKKFVGDSGLYIVAGVSGLSDMDAITLSTARLAHSEEIQPLAAWRTILIAAASNMVAKGVIVASLANTRLKRIIFTTFGLLTVFVAIVWAVWPFIL